MRYLQRVGALTVSLMSTAALAKSANPVYSESNLLARDAVVRFEPIPPTALEDLEGNGHGASLVSRHYGRGRPNSTYTGYRGFALRDQESFFWGQNGNPLANLTAYADNKGVKVLSLERFSNVLNTAKCGIDTIDLSFAQEVQFDEIRREWHWVNDAAENYIVFVTESAQCNVADGDASIRQPWQVTGAEFDDASNVVTLHAEPRTWEQAFSNWNLRISSTGILPGGQQRRLLARGPLDIDFAKSIPIDHSFTGSSVTAGGLSLTCSDCKIEGSLEFDIDISPKVLTLHPGLDGYVKFGADGVGATVELTVAISASDGGSTFEKELFDIPLPYSIDIPHVITLGPQLKYELSGSIGKTESKAEFTTGLKLDIHDNAIYYHNFDSGTNQIASWTPKLKPLKPDFDVKSSVSATFAGDTKLLLQGKAMGVNLELGFSLAAPSFNIQAETSKECGKKKNKPGVSLDVGVGVTIDAYEVAKAEFLGKERKIDAKQPIYSTSTPIYSTCLAKPTAARMA